MSMATDPPGSVPFYVPTVDITPYLADPASSGADKVIADIRAAGRSTGFFQMIGHGLSRSLQRAAFDAAAAFFALPFEEKKKLDAKATVGHRGYDVLASQSYEEGVMPDLKEVRPLPPRSVCRHLTRSPGLLRRHRSSPLRSARCRSPLLHGAQRLAGRVRARSGSLP